MDPGDLYGLPLERFTEERNALAKELRRRGRGDETADVSKLRKPSVAAWAVNQLVRTQRRDLDALLSAGDALQAAQAELLAGRSDPGSLRKAVDAQRGALARLTEKARGLLSADGHELTPARLEQVRETLEAAALDPGARASVSDGCLERELRHVGLGPLTGGPVRLSRKPKADPRATVKARADARRRLERAERELGEAEEALTSSRERVQAARREHRLAQQELRKLE
jgi:hypothetical protein